MFATNIGTGFLFFRVCFNRVSGHRFVYVHVYVYKSSYKRMHNLMQAYVYVFVYVYLYMNVCFIRYK